MDQLAQRQPSDPRIRQLSAIVDSYAFIAPATIGSTALRLTERSLVDRLTDAFQRLLPCLAIKRGDFRAGSHSSARPACPVEIVLYTDSDHVRHLPNLVVPHQD